MGGMTDVKPEHAPDVLGFGEADLTERVAEAMKQASRAYVTAILLALSAEGFTALTPATLSLLSRLPEGGVQSAVIARATGRTKQATSKLVSELESAGYVERIADPNDRRGLLVKLTARGRAAMAVGLKAKAGLSGRAGDALGVERLTQLQVDLEALGHVMSSRR